MAESYNLPLIKPLMVLLLLLLKSLDLFFPFLA